MMYFPKYLKNIPGINHHWLPIKAHYFFLFGTIAGVLTFMPVIGKDLGLNATAVGITYTLLPISIFVFKPFFGFLADCLQNIKTIVICLMTATVTLLICVSFIEPLHKNEYNTLEAYLQCINKTERLSFDFKEPCLLKLRSFGKIICNVSDQYKLAHNIRNNNRTFDVEAEFGCNNDNSYLLWENKDHQRNFTAKCLVLFKVNFSEVKDMCEDRYSLTASSLSCNHKLETCLVTEKKSNVYSTYQFWTFTFLVVAGGTFFTTTMSLSDVACYEILEEQKEYYGRQRLWGTVSTGIVTFLTGYFNDLISKAEGKTEYLAGFYIMIVLFITNMAILAYIQLPKAKLSKNIMSDIKTLFKSSEFIVYGFAVFVIGIFSGLVANYLFWYLKDLGANQTLLGLAVAVQCLAAEVPFFFFAGWFIKHLGYFNCLTCSFTAFAVRFGLYSLLRNPWFALPIETLHGMTFAVFYASKTAFVSVYAPPGTEGTVLGILGGLCDGLGFASGSLLGGLGFDRLGGSQTFLIACVLGLICIPATCISHFIFKKRLSR